MRSDSPATSSPLRLPCARTERGRPAAARPAALRVRNCRRPTGWDAALLLRMGSLLLWAWVYAMPGVLSRPAAPRRLTPSGAGHRIGALIRLVRPSPPTRRADHSVREGSMRRGFQLIVPLLTLAALLVTVG